MKHQSIKRLLLSAVFLFALLSPMGALAEHLQFMGVPINGTISTFHQKLLAKGLRPSTYNNRLEVGVRAFEGRFAGYDVTIFVYYDETSKIVYQCRVAFEDESQSDARSRLSIFKQNIADKYRYNSLNSEELKVDYSQDEYGFAIFSDYPVDDPDVLGSIELSVNGKKDNWSGKYWLAIDYTDYINSEKHKSRLINDL